VKVEKVAKIGQKVQNCYPLSPGSGSFVRHNPENYYFLNVPKDPDFRAFRLKIPSAATAQTTSL